MPTLIPHYVERTLKQIILKDLENKGRPEFDKNHTLAVVYWTKQILQSVAETQLAPGSAENLSSNKNRLNPKVLITAAYAHNWGYIAAQSQLLASGARPTSGTPMSSYNHIQTQKNLHMWQGSIMIERLLYQRLSSHFTENEISRVTHLVWWHDKLQHLKDEDETLLMEANTLGGLDVDRVTPTFNKQDNQKYLQGVRKKRQPLFIHPEAKKMCKILLQKREDFYKKL